jgi:hypothetical protein
MNTERPVEPPHIRMPVETLVQERGTGDQLLWIEGVLPLPIGSRISLDNLPSHRQVPFDPERFPTGTTDAVVVNVSLWGPQSPIGCLVLEVKLTEPAGTDDTEAGGRLLSRDR